MVAFRSSGSFIMNSKGSLSKFLLGIKTSSQSTKFIQLRSVILGLKKIKLVKTYPTVNVLKLQNGKQHKFWWVNDVPGHELDRAVLEVNNESLHAQRNSDFYVVFYKMYFFVTPVIIPHLNIFIS